MALPLYLAMTAAEMAGDPPLPSRLAYMACHFSPCGRGLSNLPDMLPTGAMLILDDSTPMAGHDPELILTQLSEQMERHNCESLLLDFQRPGCDGLRELAKLLSEALPCPVGVSDLYAKELSCPVFLSPIPPDRPADTHLAPWRGREVWLEAALDGTTLTLTEKGCSSSPLFDFPSDGLLDAKLYCRYEIETSPAAAKFHLWRTRADLNTLLSEAESHCVSKAIGLWQELGR